MNRYILIILVLSIISDIKSSQMCDWGYRPEKAEDCLKLEVDKDDGDYCCYEIKKYNDGTEDIYCAIYDREDYKEKDENIQYEKEYNNDLKEYDIVCNSSYYLKFSLLFILIIIL